MHAMRGGRLFMEGMQGRGRAWTIASQHRYASRGVARSDGLNRDDTAALARPAEYHGFCYCCTIEERS